MDERPGGMESVKSAVGELSWAIDNYHNCAGKNVENGKLVSDEFGNGNGYKFSW